MTRRDLATLAGLALLPLMLPLLVWSIPRPVLASLPRTPAARLHAAETPVAAAETALAGQTMRLLLHGQDVRYSHYDTHAALAALSTVVVLAAPLDEFLAGNVDDARTAIAVDSQLTPTPTPVAIYSSWGPYYSSETQLPPYYLAESDLQSLAWSLTYDLLNLPTATPTATPPKG